MIDSHTHIYLPEFDDDREDVIRRAIDVGITHLVLPNVDLETIAPLQQLCHKHPTLCLPTMGLHPTSVDENYQETLAQIKQLVENNHYYAIGEIGIDLYWEKKFLQQQQDALHQQVEWAIKQNLPIIVHTRESHDETIEVLASFPQEKLRGVFHSFTGTPQQAEEIAALGNFYFGINGIVTFKNSTIKESVATIGLSRILLETDAPYLTPAPYRGKRNEPAYLTHITAKLAELFNCATEVVEQETTKNSQALFAI